MAIILAATDKMSRTVDRAFGKVNAKLDATQRRADKIARASGNFAAETGRIGLSMAAPLAFAANEAVKFEDKMADVGKVLDLSTGSAELSDIGREVRQLSVELGKTPAQVSALYAGLAQGGAPKENLKEIAKLAGQVGVAFDIDPGIAGSRFIKLSNAMELTIEQTQGVTDAINHLSDNSAAKASEMLDFFAAGGAGASRAMKITGQEGAALASVYLSMGKSGSESATIIERMTKTLRNQDKQAGAIFAKSGGGLQGILSVLEKGSKLSGAEKFEFFKEFGEYGIEVEQLANNAGLLQKQLALVSDKAAVAGSVQREFANRSQTTAFRLAQAKANAQSLAIEVGNNLLPIITDILAKVTPFVQKLTDWAEKNPELTKTIVKVTAVTAAAFLGISAVSGVISATATVVGALTTGFRALSTVGALLTKGMGLLNIVLTANPIGATVVAVAALSAGIYALWQRSEKFRGTIMGVWEVLKKVGDIIKNNVMRQAQGLGNVLAGIYNRDFGQIKLGVAQSVASVPQAIAETANANFGERFRQGYNQGAYEVSGSRADFIARPQSTVEQGQGRSNSTAVEFAPVINVQGGTSMGPEDFRRMMKGYEPELVRVVEGAQRREDRKKF